MKYESDSTEEFDRWLDALKDARARVIVNTRISRAKAGNFGDWKTESGEVRAMRIDYGPGYRIYYTIRGNKLILLLCGGDKSTQTKDIKKATELAKEV